MDYVKVATNIQKGLDFMKKILSVIISIIIACTLFTGCNNTTSPDTRAKYNIVCTIYPQYDWVMNLLGDNANDYNVTLLLNNGTDLHNYQPSARDIVTIASSDMFIYVGGESDKWVHDVLKNSGNEKTIAINMLECLGENIYEEETVEGMQAEKHSLFDFSHDDEETEYDEHVWLSLKNAKKICENISKALCGLDSRNSSSYKKNLENYTEKLTSLDEKYMDTVAQSKTKTLLFGDRFPFRYLTEDYNINYYAAFPGCSAETEASFKTIVFLANKADELNLSTICVTESSDLSVAKTIMENTGTKKKQIVTFNSLQSVTKNDIDNKVSYLSYMEDNLKALNAALN